MCYLKKVSIAYLLIISVSAAKNSAKDVIGFPEAEENPELKNQDGRQPVYLPAKCPANELYYPGDQKDDWICDCRPAYIFHPTSDACWPAFQRGPCDAGQYLILPPNSVLPVCEKNPCEDTYVMWEGKCAKLGSTDSCGQIWPPKTTALGVNAATLEVSCVKLNLENRFGPDDAEKPTSTVTLCPAGARRSVTGKCTPNA